MDIENKKIIKDKVKKIFNNRFGINMDVWKLVNDKHLLGKEIGLSSRDLIYILFDIENEFDIQIPQDVIVNNGLVSFNAIIETICDCITHSSELTS